MLEALHGVGDGRRNDVANDVEVWTRFVVAEERLKLDAGLLSACNGVRFIGLELRELEIESLEVELGEVAGFKAFVAYVELVFEVGEVVIGEFSSLPWLRRSW